MRLLELLVLSSLLLTPLAPAQAQAQDSEPQQALWSGSLGLAVVVVDDSGAGIPGAVVALQWGEAGEGGPPAVRTGADGRAEILGLAAGEWQVDVQREGYMLYTAFVALSPTDSPDIGFSSRQRTGTFWAPLEVRFGRAGDPPELLAGDRATAREAQREAEKERRRREREERRAERDDYARLVETERSEESVEDVGTEESTVESETAGAPPDVTPPARAVPSLPVDGPLLPAGACRECGPGEWALDAGAVAGPARPGAPGCSVQADDLLERVARELGELPSVPADLAAPITGDGGALARIADEELRLDLETELAAVAGADRSCVPVAVLLPPGARYVGFRYGASDDWADGECRATEDCQIGEASWLIEPRRIAVGDTTVIWALFENRSPERRRTAQLRVYFEPRAGWLPPP